MRIGACLCSHYGNTTIQNTNRHTLSLSRSLTQIHAYTNPYILSLSHTHTLFLFLALFLFFSLSLFLPGSI